MKNLYLYNIGICNTKDILTTHRPYVQANKTNIINIFI